MKRSDRGVPNMKGYGEEGIHVTHYSFRKKANELQEKLMGRDKTDSRVWIAPA